MSAMPRTIHLWVPGCRPGDGGVQRFSYELLTALREGFPQAAIWVLSKNDRAGPPPVEPAPAFTFQGTGHLPERWRTLAYSLRLVWAAWRERPALIVTTHVNFSPLARLLQRWWGIPYVVVAHGIDVWDLPDGRVKQGIRAADRVLAVSRYTQGRLLKELGLPLEQVQVLPNTVRAGAFDLGPKPAALLTRYGLRAEQPVLLTVTRLAPAERYKGYDQVLAVVPALVQQIPDLHYVIVGKGGDRARVEALIQKAGMAAHVTLAGFVPDADLNDHYNLGDIFVMPSRREGFGIVFLEALACGKPVVAGNEDGSVDPLMDGELGVLINPQSLEELSAALLSILQHRHPLAILQDPTALRQKMLQQFGFPVFVEKVKAALEPWLGRAGPEVDG
jgi:phosphatidylinositol alpha-1,6-mannosyltransferase